MNAAATITKCEICDTDTDTGSTQTLVWEESELVLEACAACVAQNDKTDWTGWPEVFIAAKDGEQSHDDYLLSLAIG